MDIKLKNKSLLLVWLLLLSYGAGGILHAWNRLYYFTEQPFYYWIYLGACLTALLTLYVWQKNIYFADLLAPEKWQKNYNRIPLDAAAFVLIISFFITTTHLESPSFISARYFPDIIYYLITYSLFGIVVTGMTVIQITYLVRRLKYGSDLKTDLHDTILFRSYQVMKEAFLNKRTGTQVVLILGFVFFSGGSTVAAIVGIGLNIFILPVILLPILTTAFILLLIILKRTGDFNKITAATAALSEGSVTEDLKVKGKSALATHAAHINQLKQDVNISKREQAKSERLKTELITNVSHDLRTPLTSIMTYTQLLKDQMLTDEERNQYVGIIDQKSKRLKMLIEDLFEASKMASGSIELSKTKVDLNQLLEQSLAEHSEAIEESTLQLRVTKPDHPLPAHVDGQKIWRVFDNLISNMMKYSLPNTRVYIHLEPAGSMNVITFRNISAYELNGNIDELFERFKRGDESRHTEGSGLGLAIAKSIIDLHGGDFDLDADGDLFKVTIRLAA
ncbi:sensor histidine kinase [Jeotgalibacillus terrae]|uniref:histidine kinase n=1 Tax=Jeotgalibacillus terrae TaxID=587735 RepID=A0ABW5ZK36_9BACL|nr:HAMP domain-containing sensor histidine kinase [Jeotgalibacillus terrae]MBM7578044.1 signal transduction histidine kinase [Jeotgalibacillus terrae]